MVHADDDHWIVRYIRTLRERFRVYVDQRGTLRTEHVVRFLGLTILRLHYRMDRMHAAAGAEREPGGVEKRA